MNSYRLMHCQATIKFVQRILWVLHKNLLFYITVINLTKALLAIQFFNITCAFIHTYIYIHAYIYMYVHSYVTYKLVLGNIVDDMKFHNN